MTIRGPVEIILQEIRGQFEEIIVSAVDYVVSGQIITDPFGVQAIGAPDGTQFLAEFLFLMVILGVGVAAEIHLDQTGGSYE